VKVASSDSQSLEDFGQEVMEGFKNGFWLNILRISEGSESISEAVVSTQHALLDEFLKNKASTKYSELIEQVQFFTIRLNILIYVQSQVSLFDYFNLEYLNFSVKLRCFLIYNILYCIAEEGQSLPFHKAANENRKSVPEGIQ
jgi:hypothetical protein